MLLILFFLVILFFFLPGVLLHMLLHERNITLPVALGLAMAGLVVVDVWAASIFGYRFWIQFALNVIAIAALGWLARGKMRGWWQWATAWRPHYLIGWVAVSLFFILPAFVIPVPYDTDAQGFAILGLTVRLGGNITNLAPFWPEVGFFYSPAFFLLSAQLSDMAGGAPMHLVMLAMGHAFAVATVLGVWAVGHEFGDERVANWAVAFSVLSTALFTTLMDAAYTNIFGNFLTTTILVMVLRASRYLSRLNIIFAIIALASLPISHPDSILHLLMAYIPFYFSIWLAKLRPNLKQYAALTILIPFTAIVLCTPWIIRVFPLLGGVNVHERQNPDSSFSYIYYLLNGGIPAGLAGLGLLIAFWRRRWVDLWMIGLMFMIWEIGIFARIDGLVKDTPYDFLKIFYPFGVLWHATIIPVPYLAATFVRALPFMERIKIPPRFGVAVSAGAILCGVAATVFSAPLLQLTKGRVAITGALSSEADVQAMYWLRDHTPRDVFILNYPGIEGDWAPAIAERKTVHFREQLFYIGAQAAWHLQDELRPAYHDPVSPESEKLIRAAKIDYVLVPQVIGRPEAFKVVQRWRKPFVEPMKSSFAQAAYLELVKDFDGAQIWKVK